MPNINEAAKAWELELAGRVGKAVQARRKALDLTAVQLSERTRELGYPITRVTITKIETNNRVGKVDVAELLVLAVALEIPPALLLFPDFPDGQVATMPGRETENNVAVKWLSGLVPSMWTTVNQPADPELNGGAVLVQTVELVAETEQHLERLHGMLTAKGAPPDAVETTRRLIQTNEKQLARLRADVARTKDELWGIAEERRTAARQQIEAERQARHAEWVATPEGAAKQAEWVARQERGSDE
jgi:transcriptional regulator with XRE-family HTH domain